MQKQVQKNESTHAAFFFCCEYKLRASWNLLRSFFPFQLHSPAANAGGTARKTDQNRDPAFTVAQNHELLFLLPLYIMILLVWNPWR